MKAMKVALVFLLVAIFQISWHWFLSLNNRMAQMLLKLYLAYDPKLHKGVAPVTDILLPSVVIGACTGFFIWNWCARNTCVVIFVVSLGVVGLLPIYAFLLGFTGVWWWPKQNGEWTLLIIEKVMQSILVVAIFAFGGQQIGLYLQERHRMKSRL